MKIISKYKDYYDYFAGIYGEDEKIILDRRKGNTFKNSELFYSYRKCEKIILLAICDILYVGIIDVENKKIYWCHEIKENYNIEKSKGYFSSIYGENELVLNSSSLYIFSPIEFKINTQYNCAILCKILDSNDRNNISKKLLDTRNWIEFPRLEELKIASILPAKEIYLNLTSFLSPVDKTADNMNDVEKIKSHGFDTKKSFRKPKR